MNKGQGIIGIMMVATLLLGAVFLDPKGGSEERPEASVLSVTCQRFCYEGQFPSFDVFEGQCYCVNAEHRFKMNHDQLGLRKGE